VLRKGERVGELRFADSDGKEYTLGDFGQNRAVVFFFYPMDFSPGCTMEACHFRDSYDQIRKLGGEVFGVSTGSAQTQSRFRQKHDLPYRLIPDQEKMLSKTFGADRLGGLVLNRRATFVVAPDGEIVDAIHAEFSMAGHVKRAIETLERLKSKPE